MYMMTIRPTLFLKSAETKASKASNACKVLEVRAGDGTVDRFCESLVLRPQSLHI